MINISIPFTTYREVEKSIPIIKEELSKNNIYPDNKSLEKITIEIMTNSYSSGGWYSKEELISYTKIYIQQIYSQVVQKELIKNKIKMDEHDIWFLTGEIIKILHNNNHGVSEKEIRDMTKQCINNGLYKKFIGYSKKLDDRIMPVTGNK